MVGKIKRERQKLHQGAVKIERNPTTLHLEKAPTVPQPSKHHTRHEAHVQKSDDTKDVKIFNFPQRIFAGTKITPDALVQTLKFDEPSTVQTTAQTAEDQKGGGERKRQSKKEKMKERRDRWLNKISSIKLAREQQVALARRKATPVVGDMKPLADALPELSQLLPSAGAHAPNASLRKQRRVVKKKAEPTDYSQMKPAQKRKLLELESSHFSKTLKDSTFKANPLVAIGEHLRKRLRQEDEQS
ncbi:ribosome biogenesis protein SLX9 homolog [Brachyhypopomus gauderio]|uniref:ribosome biogenesis protein SLX9 homolog n=1 Tax=Brachyhypopomus gauderio TaxID=698409 RepID=UPI0040437BCF